MGRTAISKEGFGKAVFMIYTKSRSRKCEIYDLNSRSAYGKDGLI